MRHVKLILGDQLNARHSWFRAPDDRVVFVLAELRQETEYVRALYWQHMPEYGARNHLRARRALSAYYWHFLARNRETLQGNARLKLVYANWDRQKPDQREAVLNTAEHHLSQINKLRTIWRLNQLLLFSVSPRGYGSNDLKSCGEEL